jgi:hypothetical protein
MRHPEDPRFHQRGEGSPTQIMLSVPRELRLKSGSAQDDATEKKCVVLTVCSALAGGLFGGDCCWGFGLGGGAGFHLQAGGFEIG